MSSLRYALGLPGGGAVSSPPFASDDFTGTDLDAINGRVAPIGGTWAQHTSYAASGVIVANRMVTSGTACAYLDATPPSANYIVRARMTCLSDNNSHAIGISGRISTVANTMYHVRRNTSTEQWELFKFIAGAATSLGTSAAAFGVGETKELILSMIGSVIRVYVDGALLIDVTNGDITAAGKVGFRGNGTGDVGIGIHMDDFRAVAA